MSQHAAYHDRIELFSKGGKYLIEALDLISAPAEHGILLFGTHRKVMQGLACHLGEVHVFNIGILEHISELIDQGWLLDAQLRPRRIVHGHVDYDADGVEHKLAESMIKNQQQGLYELPVVYKLLAQSLMP